VDSDTASGIQNLDCYDQIEKSGYQPLKLGESDFQIGRRENGECQFWKGGGCEIHREAGGARKPSVCQLFPFGLVNTPDGYFVSLSYSCPTVLANSGPPAERLREDIVQAVSSASHLDNAKLIPDSQFRLTAERKIGWSEYLQIEKRLQISFDARSPFLSLLLQVSRILEKDHNLHPNQSVSLPEAARLLPLFVCNTLGLLEFPDDEESRQDFAVQLQQGGTPNSPLLGNRKLTEFQILDPRTKQETDLVERFVGNFTFGKRLTTGPTIVARILMLTSALAVLGFYLRQLTPEGEEHGPKQLEWAFDILETDMAVYRKNLEPAFLHFEQLLRETYENSL
jgi:Fe-S-cluster containining protein